MSWFKVDDGFYDHPKVLDTDMAALGLWTLAGSYCARHLTDGAITERQIRAIGGTLKQAEKLVEAGLWSVENAPTNAHRALTDGSPSAHRRSGERSPNVRRFVFNDWAEFQPSRADVTARRQEDAERKREARARKRAKQQERKSVQPDVPTDVPTDVQPESARRVQRESARSPLYPTRPDPTRPDPTPKGVEVAQARPARERATRLPDEWMPSRSVIDAMRDECPGVDLEAEHRKFVDHWHAKSGADATKLDWDATWRNWIRRAAERTPAGRRTATQKSGGWIGTVADAERLMGLQP